MKTITLLFFTLFSINLYSQIITVDNRTGSADYENLQLAIDAASDGDTIYVAGTTITYGDITVDKELTIFGNGYEGTAASPSTTINNITLLTNSQTSHFSGLIANQIDKSSPNHSLDSITVSDCKINQYLRIVGGKGHVIEGNLFLGGNSNSIIIAFGAGSYQASQTIIKNNNIYSSISYSREATNLIENNTFIRKGVSSSDRPLLNCSNTTLVNNIFYGSSPADIGNCASCPNLSSSHYYHDGTSYIGSNPLFVSPDTLASNNVHVFSEDHDLNLQAGSPAQGAGQNGFDLGSTGGATPFKYGGFAPIPRITNFNSSTSIIEEGQTIQVTIEAESNN